MRWLGPFPTASWPVERVELRESVELAFAAALQHLPPRQRAVLLLRDVLGYSARETAEMLDITPTAAHSALQHARSSVTSRVTGTSQQRSLRALGDAALRNLVDRYVRALESGDVGQVLALLTDDATWSMPPSPACFRGHGEIAQFLREGPLRHRWRHVPTSVNAQLAVACYAWDDDRGGYVGRVVDVLTVRGSRIAAVTAFVDAGALEALQLPGELR